MKNDIFDQDEQSRGLTVQVMKCFAGANHKLHWIFSKAKRMLACRGNPENVCAAFFFFGGDAEAPPPPPPPPFPNGSGLLPAILLFNPLIRRSTEKRFAGGRWPCPVAASYVSDGTRPVDTRGISAAEERRGLRPARFEAGGFKSAQKKVPPTPKHATTSFVVHLFISKR